MRTTSDIIDGAVRARRALATVTTQQKNEALEAMTVSLLAAESEILAANEQDLAAARGAISEVMLDRLALTAPRLQQMGAGIRAVIALPDPVGRVLKETTRADGLCIRRVSAPMGVIAIIYESRPNVTSDAAALALKAGSAAVLRCGKEAWRTSAAIVAALRRGLAQTGLPEDAISLVEDTSRASAAELMTAEGRIDLLIPRGGAGLIRACVENATVPCIHTGTGICHIYVDRTADVEKALNIVENAKTSRPSVCNAAEVLLVHRDIADTFIPRVKARLSQVTFIEGEFDTEFLDYKMGLGIVDSLDAAIEHIARHSTHHSEAIVTEDAAAGERFQREVDSAAVYVNASTRFTDGGEFGLGCEMGISTQKLHARGPMGLEELCTTKYVINGNGQIR